MKTWIGLLFVLVAPVSFAAWEIQYRFDGAQHAAGSYVDELGCDILPLSGHNQSGTYVYWETYFQYNSDTHRPGSHLFGISSHVGWNEQDPGDTAQTFGPESEQTGGTIMLYSDKSGVLNINKWANPTGQHIGGIVRFRCIRE